MLPSVSGFQTTSKVLKADQPMSGLSSSRDSSIEVDCSGNKNSDCDSSISNIHMDNSPGKSAESTSKQGSDVELRYACEQTGNQRECSTSGSHLSDNMRVHQRNRTAGERSPERSKRKRWRGRLEDESYTPSISSGEGNKIEIRTDSLNCSTYLSEEHQVIVMLFFAVMVL